MRDETDQHSLCSAETYITDQSIDRLCAAEMAENKVGRDCGGLGDWKQQNTSLGYNVGILCSTGKAAAFGHEFEDRANHAYQGYHVYNKPKKHEA